MSQNPAATGTGLLHRLALSHQGRASIWRFALVALWFAWAALLFGGFLLGSPHDNDTRRMPTWCRMGSSLVLVLAAWTWFAATAGRRTHRYALFIALGMSLGFVGDLFNAGLLRLGLPDPVLGGIAAFGLGHIAYIAACWYAGNAAGARSTSVNWTSLIAWWLISLLCWYVVAYRAAENDGLRWPALPYTLLLATMTGMAMALALQTARFTILAIGGVLFLVSDLVLAWQLFQGPFHLGSDVVWLLYGPAQMFIVYSIAVARRSIDRVDFALAPGASPLA